jgi:hypothetical protein
VQGLLEVQLAAHGACGDLGDLVLAPGVCGEEFDHLVLDERRVDIHDDQPLSPALETGGDHGDVDAVPGGLQGEGRTQDGGLGPGDVELHSRDGVLGEPEDAVDVAAGGGDAGGDRGGRTGGERLPEHRHVRTARAARLVVAPAGDDLGLQPHRLGPAVHDGPQLALARRGV